jgi:hypothetical protein
MVQNILDPKQIIDDKSKPIIIFLGESFRLLGLFHDKHSKEYLFLSIQDHLLNVHIKKL